MQHTRCVCATQLSHELCSQALRESANRPNQGLNMHQLLTITWVWHLF